MSYKPGDSYYKEFTTADPSTGAAQDADSLPTATANHNGTDDGTFTMTVAKIDTGRYKITGTIPSGYVKGDVINVTVAATVNSVAGKACVDTQVLDSKRVGDLNDAPAVTAATIAETYLKYDMSVVTGEASKSPINCLRKMRDWSISGTTLTVYKEDGTTPAYTQTLTATAGVDPITSIAG